MFTARKFYALLCLLCTARIQARITCMGLHTQFRFTGCYGELLPWISKVLDQWLPESGLKVKSTPAFVEYQRNHFLDPEERFELSYYLPVSLY